ncbi:hypothetical protein AIOL_002929 [Candidatus Rhodobacter oscarellae]|uniref:Uncharacterized protein n=1 Tax=Candidatus Rhodobacter oscarellae TaxID=1675527 RepID=A0A0J9E5J8_9RHOB|nr:hypothetical protein AIOL_002929 [Candidatus Rhodobacter lobularis]
MSFPQSSLQLRHCVIRRGGGRKSTPQPHRPPVGSGRLVRAS